MGGDLVIPLTSTFGICEPDVKCSKDQLTFRALNHLPGFLKKFGDLKLSTYLVFSSPGAVIKVCSANTGCREQYGYSY